MNERFVDLHTHTIASDGTATPAELVRAAKEAGIAILAVTDHDTTAGVAPACEAAQAVGITLIAGVELSAEGAPGKCHLLALGIDPDHDELNATLAALAAARRARNVKIIARLQALGVAITMDEVAAAAPPGANIGRPHFAQVLVAKGIVPDTQSAFNRYLADSAAAYVDRESLSPAEAIALTHRAGGVCLLAHPGLVRLADHETEEGRIRALTALGLDGVEAFYSGHTPAQEARFVRIAERLGLLTSGGSDFHGAHKPATPLGIVRDGTRLTADRVAPLLQRVGVSDAPA